MRRTTQRFYAHPTTIYFGDNGRALCGHHLGAQAQSTGRDLSGQRILAVYREDILSDANMAPYVDNVRCETCRRPLTTRTEQS